LALVVDGLGEKVFDTGTMAIALAARGGAARLSHLLLETVEPLHDGDLLFEVDHLEVG
jgi:hypothetical protein